MSADSGNNIRSLRAPRREISYDWQLGRYTLRYDDTTLQVEWQVNSQRRITRHDLLLLSPLFIEDSTQIDTLLPAMRRFGMFSSAAIIIWFSQVNVWIPLLAPTLALLALGWLFKLVVDYQARGARTVICESAGDEVIDIPHDRTNDEQRMGFETGLKRAIETVHKQWRDGEI